MRKTNFKDSELREIKHQDASIGENGTFYVPVLSSFELEDYTGILASHCVEVANRRLGEMKEIESENPLSQGFQYKDGSVVIWAGRPAPQNAYEEKVMLKAQLTFTQLTLTMFMCDVNGECICPFIEPFGTISSQRLNLFSKMFKDTEAINAYNNAIMGITVAEEAADKIVIPLEKKNKRQK